MSSFVNSSSSQATDASVAVTEVFDPEFKHIYVVPDTVIAHLPPTQLNITRLVVCRNYRPCNRDSCSMGENCKFVHIDYPLPALECHTVHVNYIWRDVHLCTYPRLPAGETVEVLLPNMKQPSSTISSDFILPTKCSIAYMNWRKEARRLPNGVQPVNPPPSLSHCAHYHFNGMCNRGEECNFIHAVVVDPTVQGDFKRIPGRPHRRAPTTTGNALRSSKPASTTATTAAPTSIQQKYMHAFPTKVSPLHSDSTKCFVEPTPVVHVTPNLCPLPAPKYHAAGSPAVGDLPAVIEASSGHRSSIRVRLNCSTSTPTMSPTMPMRAGNNMSTSNLSCCPNAMANLNQALASTYPTTTAAAGATGGNTGAPPSDIAEEWATAEFASQGEDGSRSSNQSPYSAPLISIMPWTSPRRGPQNVTQMPARISSQQNMGTSLSWSHGQQMPQAQNAIAAKNTNTGKGTDTVSSNSSNSNSNGIPESGEGQYRHNPYAPCLMA